MEKAVPSIPDPQGAGKALPEPHPTVTLDAAQVAEALTSPEVQKVLRDRYGLRPRVVGP